MTKSQNELEEMINGTKKTNGTEAQKCISSPSILGLLGITSGGKLNGKRRTTSKTNNDSMNKEEIDGKFLSRVAAKKASKQFEQSRIAAIEGPMMALFSACRQNDPVTVKHVINDLINDCNSRFLKSCLAQKPPTNIHIKDRDLHSCHIDIDNSCNGCDEKLQAKFNESISSSVKTGFTVNNIVSLLETKYSHPIDGIGLGSTALHIAAYNESVDVMRVLINISKIENRDNNNEHIADIKENNSHCFVKINLNIKNSNGQTPLHIAAKRGCKKVVQLLCTNGAEVCVKDNYGHSPLFLCQREAYRSSNHRQCCVFIRNHFTEVERIDVGSKRVKRYKKSRVCQ